MRHTKKSSRLERVLLAVSIAFIAFIVVFGGPRSRSNQPPESATLGQTGVAHRSVDSPEWTAVLSHPVVLTRSSAPTPLVSPKE
jgi:hypothetical protein